MNNHQNTTLYNVTILTLYKDAFPGYLGFGVASRAINKAWTLNVIDIRDFAEGNYKKVDDTVFGGGKGLLLKPDVLGKAVDSAYQGDASKNLVFPNPKGKLLNNEMAKELAREDGITIICGHFEGIDERVIEYYKPKEVSIGDYICSGGELPAMVLLDSILRFVPNVLNSSECVEKESFQDNLLEYPQYTKPVIWKGKPVPEILLSGNHAKIEEWRRNQAESHTKLKRPDLWAKYKN